MKHSPRQRALLPTVAGDAPLVDGDALRIHGLKLGNSNAYLIETGAGITLVDAGLPTSARKVLRKLQAIGRPDDLCQIFITHAHIDHFGAAAELRARTGARIICHAADADALSNGRSRLGTVHGWNWTRSAVPMIEWLITIRDTPPDRTVVDGERISECGLDATVLLTPGHTAGSSTLLVRDPATHALFAFVADLISTTGGAHVQSSYAQNWGQLAPSIARLRAAAPDLIFPGHGDTILTGGELAALVISGPAAPQA